MGKLPPKLVPVLPRPCGIAGCAFKAEQILIATQLIAGTSPPTQRRRRWCPPQHYQTGRARARVHYQRAPAPFRLSSRRRFGGSEALLCLQQRNNALCLAEFLRLRLALALLLALRLVHCINLRLATAWRRIKYRGGGGGNCVPLNMISVRVVRAINPLPFVACLAFGRLDAVVAVVLAAAAALNALRKASRPQIESSSTLGLAISSHFPSRVSMVGLELACLRLFGSSRVRVASPCAEAVIT